MSRPSRIFVDPTALLHNLRRVQQCAPSKKIIAMVKANAYGHGISTVLPVLDGRVEAFGVASLEEAIALRRLGSRSECILFQGVFNSDEYQLAASLNLQCVIHHREQLQWLFKTALDAPIKIWVKVDTGMHRLGFSPDVVHGVIAALTECPWVQNEIGLMTHFSSADEPERQCNRAQMDVFAALSLPKHSYIRSLANSAAILSLPESHADAVRPGIMLYGISPFAQKIGSELGLVPVMRFTSAISAIHQFPVSAPIGYSGAWVSQAPCTIGVVPVGYGDGYPRLVTGAMAWVNDSKAPVVGRVSMDMLSIDLSHCQGAKIGDEVELWGKNIPIEHVARAAGTTAYELVCQLTSRVRENFMCNVEIK